MKRKASDSQKPSAIKKRCLPRRYLFESLPNELTINILGRVASQEPFSLLSSKLRYLFFIFANDIWVVRASYTVNDRCFFFISCKLLYSLSNYEQVMKKVSIETIINCMWLMNSNARFFFGRCLDCNNPNALLRYDLLS